MFNIFAETTKYKNRKISKLVTYFIKCKCDVNKNFKSFSFPTTVVLTNYISFLPYIFIDMYFAFLRRLTNTSSFGSILE